MNKKITMAALLTCHVSLTVFLFFKSADNGADQYAAIEQAVRAIDQRNADLDAAVLSLRLGIMLDYDELMRCEAALAASRRTSIDSGATFHGIRRLEARFKPLLDEKVLLVTDFKANHAVVRNSIAGFQHKIGQSRAKLEPSKLQVANQLTHLEMLGARFTITGDIYDREQFEAAILNFKSVVTTNIHSETVAKTLNFALRHARNLVDRRIELDETISNLVSVPIKAITQQTMNEAAKEYKAKSIIARRFRLGLLSTIALTLLFCIYQYASLLWHKRIINRANLTLEKRVDERTRELASKVQVIEESLNEIFIFDTQNLNFVYVNRAGRTNIGYTECELLQLTPLDIKPDYTLETFRRMVLPLDTGIKSQLLFRTTHLRKDGSTYVAEIRLQKSSFQEREAYQAMILDVTERVAAEKRNSQLQQELIDASRSAGMAEIATGVLHNVGNILNSVNVSASIIGKQFRLSAFDNLEKISGLIAEHENDFSTFVRDDQRGQKIPAYISKLTATLKKEREHTNDEFHDLVSNVNHIKEIVSAQQSMAKSSGLQQELRPEELVADSITANKGTLSNHNVQISTDFESGLPFLKSDKHKILQILVNLIKNAKDAMVEHKTVEPHIKIAVRATGPSIEFEVIDNGIGITADKIEKIFQHGFTTKKTGHGFGLHSSANAAVELGGKLSVSSPGIGAGAAFMLTLPLAMAETESPELHEACV